MLQFQTKSINICRISKLLVKYNIKSSISDSVITLEGDIPDDLITQLCNGITINSVQNFKSQESLSALNETSFLKNERFAQTEVVKKTNEITSVGREEKQLSQNVKNMEEKGYIETPQKVMVDPNEPKERKDVNMVQIRLLSFVDINELLKISQEHSTDEVKAEKILKLFGFDFNKKGVLYVLKAIIASPKDAYFNLETLSESVSKEESIDKEEVKRLIVARVKENFWL